MNHLLAIRAFSRVVESGNFTKAADSLGLPKATVTKLVQTLEGHLGVKLLQRTTRKVSVTTEGMLYYEKANALARELENIDLGIGEAQKRPRGHLRVDMGGSIANWLIIPALPEFFARYPDIRIDVSISDRAVDMIGDNIDCAIRGGSLPDSSLISRQIGVAAWVTCATPDYFKNRRWPNHPTDLRQDHVIAAYLSPKSGRPMPLRFLKRGKRCEVVGTRIVGVNDSNTHLAAGLAGLGIMQTFRLLAEPHIKSGRLIPILRDWQPPPYPFHVVYPPNRYVSSRLRVFIDWVAARFSS